MQCKVWSTRKFWMILILILVTFQAACESQPVDEIIRQTPELDLSTPVSLETFPTVDSPPETITPDIQELLGITPSPIETDEVPESTSQRVDVQTSEPATFLICPPLAGESISSMWEIISDPYNPPPPGREERHQGVDFGYYRRGSRYSVEGVEVHSILSGIVASVIEDRLPYGNMIIIETDGDTLPVSIRVQLGVDDGQSLYHLYAHMQATPPYELGDVVECGDTLGLVGTTGYNIVEPHLHLETRIGPRAQQFPVMVFYDTTATQTEMDLYVRWRTGGEFNHFDPMFLFSLFMENPSE